MAKKNLTLEEKLEEAIVKDGPYEVSRNWVWVKFEYIVQDTKLGLVRGSKEQSKDYNYNYLKMNNISSNGELDLSNLVNVDATDIEVENFSLTLGDFLFNTRNSRELVGKNTVVKSNFLKPMLFNNNIMRVRFNKVINPRVVSYYLNSPLGQLKLDEVKKVTTNVAAIYARDLNNIEIPIPPLEEQQRIVDRIESLFKKLDRAKELVEEAIEGFEKRKSAVLEKAFKGELTKDYRLINNLSPDWILDKLKYITKITSGGTPSRKRPEYFEGNIPWIKTGEIVWNNIYDSEEYITQEAIDNSSAKLIPSGSVLVAMYGQGLTRGRAAILLKEACTNQAVCALIPTEKILTRYLYFYFMKNYWNFRQLAKGGNQENLSGKVIGEFEINIPSIEEQKEIVRILDKLLEEESKIEELIQLEEQIQLIKKSILAKAFRGELGTNCEEDESALELLKEILSKKTE